MYGGIEVTANPYEVHKFLPSSYFGRQNLYTYKEYDRLFRQLVAQVCLFWLGMWRTLTWR